MAALLPFDIHLSIPSLNSHISPKTPIFILLTNHQKTSLPQCLLPPPLPLSTPLPPPPLSPPPLLSPPPSPPPLLSPPSLPGQWANSTGGRSLRPPSRSPLGGQTGVQEAPQTPHRHRQQHPSALLRHQRPPTHRRHQARARSGALGTRLVPTEMVDLQHLRDRLPSRSS
jgi:hypothetical protein